MNRESMEKYARLLVKTGINLQPNQTLVISSPIECAEFARIVSETAYREGAREVVMNWNDELSSKIRYLYAPDEIFDEFPQWRKEFYLSYAGMGAAFLSISASDPELMKDVNPDRIARANKVFRRELKEYSERLMSNQNIWCIASIPTVSWAKKVFPNHPVDEAVEKLWEAILKSVRADLPDPIEAWDRHKAVLKRNIDLLNKMQLQWIHFKNNLGTDLKIELPKNHIWMGGSDLSADGVEFIANMPTEEIFTAPSRKGVNGRVVSSMPLNYNGNLVEDFSLTFKDGEVVDIQAGKGYATLKQIIDTDEGSRYLGEIALVPYDSPISNMGILFYNTLFDENASCHLALGKAYPVCLQGSEAMSREELIDAGINDSLMHVDFMFGTPDLQIEGMTEDGKMVNIFRDGNFDL
ncbi:MAG TPA: aminopeptidase [Clostridiales bacterium]|nr:aminopeptidase [Clostridiales bacterium]